MDRRAIFGIFGALLLAGACGEGGEVEIQPLPPLNRPSPEARLGLPELAGNWRFAGWELAPDDSANLTAALPSLGQLLLETQQLDSVSGYYVAGGGRVPLAGEVRRDSVVSLLARTGPADGRYLAGRVSRDTLWIQLTSLLPQEAWPADARVAFVRQEVSAPFVRLEGAIPAVAVTDSAAALPVSPGAVAAVPDPTAAGTAAAGAPQRSPATAPPPARTPPETPPARTPPAQTPPPEREPPPDPVVDSPPPVRQPPPVPLLGEPVRRPPPDTARDTTFVR